MNKYYKVEDVEMLAIFSGVCDGKTCGEVAEALKSLPIIEASEDYINKVQVISELLLYRKTIETELTPRVSTIGDMALGIIDDCIKLVGKAPSIVPDRAEGEEIQTQIVEFPDSHQKFVFERKVEMDGDIMKICDWEYKGVKTEKGAEE